MNIINVLLGILMIVFSLFLSILDNDFTSCLMFIPMGIALMFQKENSEYSEEY